MLDLLCLYYIIIIDAIISQIVTIETLNCLLVFIIVYVQVQSVGFFYRAAIISLSVHQQSINYK